MRKSGVAGKYVRTVQVMYQGTNSVDVRRRSDTWVQGGGRIISNISSQPSLFTLVRDRLTGKIRQESPWTIKFIM